MSDKRIVKRSDLDKLFDVVSRAFDFHHHRDIMNTQTHLAQSVRISPLTSELGGALDRLKAMIEESEKLGT